MSHTECRHGAWAGGACGKPAKWLTPSGLPVCGRHRRTADSYQERLGFAARCKPLSDDHLVDLGSVSKDTK